ncbi:MAG: DNRLRE domain-containing protein [Bacteroidia bacterium]|nr:DNRLRE domain-containing protein [Bacteroidia bacterium]
MMINNFKTEILNGLIIVTLLLGFQNLRGQGSSSLVFLDGGKLSYSPFSMEGQSNPVNLIPDFSYAGYMQGGVALREVPVQVTLEPEPGDNRAAIQAAIDYVESLPVNPQGFRGAVLLRKGVYEVNGALNIEASGVVLRGEGQGDDGTVLFASLTQNHDFIRIQGTGTGIEEDPATTIPITSDYVPVGSNKMVVASATSFQVGDLVSIRRTPNQLWLDTLQMTQYGWTTPAYAIQHERRIVAINGDTLTINIPMVDVIEELYGGGTVSQAWVTGRISQCGVENLRVKSIFASGSDENHVWKAVRLRRCTDSWVKGVTAQYCGYSCVSVENESNFNTIQECAMIDQKSQISGGRRYSFNISNGMGNLFQRCYTSEGRHDFVTSSRVAGPNVFLDCLAENTFNDIGPHHRWATGTMFDNIKGEIIRVQNRGASGTGHGWAGAQTMFWNCEGTTIKVESALGSRNWGIGCIGTDQQGSGYWENWGQAVLPRSLYLQQLEDRLGPSAVDNIAIDEQKSGSINDLLSDWAGEGDFNVSQDNFSIRIKSLEDAYVAAGSFQNDNFGTDPLLSSNTSSIVDAISETYLKFDVSSINTVFEKAVLRLKVAQNNGTPFQEIAYIQDDGWSESNINWTNKPSETNSLGQVAARSAGFWIEFDISQQMLSEINGDGFLSLKIKSKGNNQLVRFYSANHPDSTNRPEIALIPKKEQIDLSPIADAYVRGGSFASDNFGSSDILALQSSSSPDDEQSSFLKFDLKGINANVTKATLRLKVDSQQSNPYQSLWLVGDNNWSENTINWTNQPAGTDSIGIGLTPGKGNYLEWDISQFIKNIAADSVLSLMLMPVEENPYTSFHSKEDGNQENHPLLILETVSSAPISTRIQEKANWNSINLSCYPNPVKEFVRLEFSLSKPGMTKIEIYDKQGKSLKTLFQGNLGSGEHSFVWQSVELGKKNLPNGMYFIRLSSQEVQSAIKVLLGE